MRGRPISNLLWLAAALCIAGCTVNGLIGATDNGGPTGMFSSGADTAPDRCNDYCTKLALNYCPNDDLEPDCNKWCLKYTQQAVAAGCGELRDKFLVCSLSATYVCNNDNKSDTNACQSEQVAVGSCLARAGDGGAKRD